MRQLVTIEKIKEINPIPDADAIEVATVKNWNVVVKKNEFKVGDYCVYFEIDSFLPIKPEFEFLRKSSYKKLSDYSEGFRLRTIKLRGQVSQGLIMPIDILKDFNKINIEEGLDVTEYLNVIKYEPPIPAQLSGIVKGNVPSFINKTDEERIQNIKWDKFYNEHKNDTIYETEKLDGTSATFYFYNGTFGVCSRNMELEYSEDNIYWKIALQYDIENKLISYGKNIAVQGEIIGEGIQKNKYNIKGVQFRVFSVFNIDKQEYVSYDELIDTVNELGLFLVPVLKITNTLFESVKDYLEYANAFSVLNKTALREGIVVQSMKGKSDFSFKVISNEFLLKYKA